MSQSLDRDLTIAKTIITFFLPLTIIFFAYVGELNGMIDYYWQIVSRRKGLICKTIHELAHLDQSTTADGVEKVTHID